MARLRSVSKEFEVVAQACEAATQRALVALAKREHATVMRTSPRPGRFQLYVDGAQGAREEAAKPFGVIEYHYARLDEVVQFAMETLIGLSPVLSGAYRMGHTIFIDGLAVTNLKTWKAGDEIVILNPLPYARKIEQGRMRMRVSGTDRVYQQAERIVTRRFGNLARIQFTYRSAVLPYLPGGANRAGRAAVRSQPARRSAMAIERETRAPALRITERA